MPPDGGREGLPGVLATLSACGPDLPEATDPSRFECFQQTGGPQSNRDHKLLSAVSSGALQPQASATTDRQVSRNGGREAGRSGRRGSYQELMNPQKEAITPHPTYRLDPVPHSGPTQLLERPLP